MFGSWCLTSYKSWSLLCQWNTEKFFLLYLFSCTLKIVLLQFHQIDKQAPEWNNSIQDYNECSGTGIIAPRLELLPLGLGKVFWDWIDSPQSGMTVRRIRSVLTLEWHPSEWIDGSWVIAEVSGTKTSTWRVKWQSLGVAGLFWDKSDRLRCGKTAPGSSINVQWLE